MSLRGKSRIRKIYLRVVSEVQARTDGGLYQDDGKGDREKSEKSR